MLGARRLLSPCALLEHWFPESALETDSALFSHLLTHTLLDSVVLQPTVQTIRAT